MLKKMTGNKVKDEQMKKLKGGFIFIIYDDWCDCYCKEHCGDKKGTDNAQADGQYEYRE